LFFSKPGGRPKKKINWGRQKKKTPGPPKKKFLSPQGVLGPPPPPAGKIKKPPQKRGSPQKPGQKVTKKIQIKTQASFFFFFPQDSAKNPVPLCAGAKKTKMGKNPSPPPPPKMREKGKKPTEIKFGKQKEKRNPLPGPPRTNHTLTKMGKKKIKKKTPELPQGNAFQEKAFCKNPRKNGRRQKTRDTPLLSGHNGQQRGSPHPLFLFAHGQS